MKNKQSNLTTSRQNPIQFMIKMELVYLVMLTFFVSLPNIASAASDPLADAIKHVENLKQDSIKIQVALKKSIGENAIKQTRIDSAHKADAAQLNTTYRGAFETGNWFVYSIGAVLCLSLIIVVLASPKNPEFPLALPDGSIRAIIAILSIILYVLISLTLAAIPQSTIASDVTKTLGTLVVAISAFYFGSKTAENSLKVGANINSDAVKAANDSNCNPVVNTPPISIIKQAVEANKENWIKLYNAKSISIGKKKSQDTFQNIDCIVFGVDQKLDAPGGSTIPPFIVYKSDGKTYNIPTDVSTDVPAVI
jgi:type II secretory pathway pseudopilin PulG